MVQRKEDLCVSVIPIVRASVSISIPKTSSFLVLKNVFEGDRARPSALQVRANRRTGRELSSPAGTTLKKLSR